MDNAKLPPIPTPFSQRWREFRIQVLPFIVFIAAIVGIVYLWRNVVQPIGIVGFVETNQVYVTSLQDGQISEMYVDRFQEVKKDQPVCVVVNTDPELVSALIQTAKADLQVILARSGVDIVRGRQSLQQLTVDLFTEKIRQVARREQLIYAETNLAALDKQRKDQIIGELAYQAGLAARNSVRDEINERDKLIQELEKNLGTMTISDEPLKAAILDAIKAKERELDLTLKPSVLKAPFDGMIAMVHHRAGEKITRGDPILTIAVPGASNIIAYVRQPIQRHPKPGDLVQVTTRTTPRRTGIAPIVKVGAQLEPINQGLLSADTRRFEVGLPIVVALPPELNQQLQLLPGEYVDIAYAQGK